MTECLQHGGYAVYVYSSYGIAAIVIAANIIWPYLRLRTLGHELRNKRPT